LGFVALGRPERVGAPERIGGIMPGTSIGIFWIDLMCKPAFKELLHYPDLSMVALFLVYSCIAYRCLKSAYNEFD